MIQNWLKIFSYQIRNNKLFAFLNVLGLSLGISGLVFAILYWNDEQSYNASNPDKERIFQVVADLGRDLVWASSTATFEPLFKTQFPEVESHNYNNGNYSTDILEYNGNKQLTEKIFNAQSSFFSFFPAEFTQGNAKTAIQDNTSMAISETVAKTFFDSENPMGKQIRYGDKVYIVRGVFKNTSKASIAPAVVINNVGQRLEEDKDKWGNFSFGLLLKLKDASQADAVKRKMEALFFENRVVKEAKAEGITTNEYVKKYGRERIHLESLESSRLHSVTDGYPEGRGNYQFLLIMVGLSVLILVLSIVNYVNLATANAIKRAKEVGVRKILGASKSNIVKQFIFEMVLTTAFSILLALVIVELALPYYNDFLQKELVIHGSQFALQLVAIFILVVLFAGIFPAIYVAGFESIKVLKGNFGRSKSGVWLRNSMLIIQFAIAAFFIIGSYIIYQQVDFMATKDLGFSGKQILHLHYRNPYNWREENYRTRLEERYNTVKQELSKIKGVEQVSAGSFNFNGGSTTFSGYNYNGNEIQSSNMSVDFGVLKMMKIKMAAGRDLSPEFSSDTIDAVLINETALKLMKEKNPIGKTINWNDRKMKIVGVVKDFNVNGPQEPIPPMLFFHLKTVPWMLNNLHDFYIKANPENMEQVIAEAEKFWTTKLDPDYPFEYDFVDKNFERTYESYVKQRNLFSLLNIVVIAIALFGLFALASYSIQRRMKEIAIRKTLGAETTTLLKSLSLQYIVFCIIGFVIALVPAYYLLDKWLENFAYRIDISPLPFAVGFVILLILTLIIVLSRAYQATKADILKYLKYE